MKLLGRNVLNINEKYMSLSAKDIDEVYDFIAKFVNDLEPALNKKRILEDIKKRNEMGEGLVSSRVLIIHIIDSKVVQDSIHYLTLKSTVKYFSVKEKSNFDLTKIVLLVVNPSHKLDKASHLLDFINDVQ